MASGVLYRSLQAPTAVSAACCITSTPSTEAVVLQLQDTRLTCWRVGADGLEQTASWRGSGSMLSMVHLPCGHLLLLAEGGQCYLHRWQQQHAAAGAEAPPLVATAQLQVPVDSSNSHVQPYGCVMSSNALSAPAGQGMASLTAVAYMSGVLHVIKASPSPAGPNSSDTQGAATSSSAAAVAAASHASAAGDSSMRLQTKAMALTHALLSCHYPGGEPPALAAVRVSCRVLGMAWLSPGEQQLDLQGRSLLAVLHEVTVASQPPVVHVDCLAVNWVEGTLSPGPWSLRNVHPTTRLLQPFPGTEQLPPGVLAISSRGVQLCTCLGGSLQQGLHDSVLQGEATSSAAAVQEAAAAAAAAAGASSSGLLAEGPCVKVVEVVVWGLGGMPLSCVPLSDSCYVVGDSSAGLHMFSVSQDPVTPAAAWMRLLPSSCLAIPDVLVHAPLTQQQQHSEAGSGEQQGQQQLSGLLLVGSKCSSSQVLGLTRACWEAATVSWSSQQGDCSLPVLQSALQPSVAGAQAVAVYQDPSGALPEQQLVVACGVSPRGKLAVVRSGCGLVPAMLDGPELPGDAQLFAIPQPQPCQHQQQQHQHQQQQQRQEQCPEQHSMLGFSFPSAGASSVMSLEGHTFRQLHLAGLQDSEASLLLTTAPGGWMVQVASSGVRVLDSSKGWQLCSQWTPTGGSISLAAAHGSHLVVACGAQVTMLAVSCCSGAVSVTATAELQQQASALSMFRLQGGQLMVAAGLWVDNSILLMPCPPAQAPQQQQVPVQLQVACSVDLDRDQPRSIALLPVGGADVLLAGSNTGKVLMWEVCSTAQQPQQQGSAQPQLGVSLQHAQAVQVSNTSVSLQQTWLPDMQPGALHSSGESSCSGNQPPPVRCVVAHAGSMAVFKPNASLLAALQSDAAAAASARTNCLPATCCVQVSRLCGSEACLGAAPVHTPDMPHSLAWVSSTQRLCFGSIAAEHKLRWRSCGLPGTPLAVAVHAASDTLVLLLAADDLAAAEQGRTDSSSSSMPQLGQQQQQRLVVLDARSLRTVMTLALAPGHTYTTLQVLDLPATSQQHQQHTALDAGGQQQSCRNSTGGAGAAGMDSNQHGVQQQQQHLQQQQPGGAGSTPGCLPFIVLGSHAVLATADTGPAARRHAAAGEIVPPRVKRVGVLSIFELKRSVVQAAAAGPQQSEAATSSAAAAAAAAAAGGGCPKSELRYELVLHGMLPMQVAPCSACTVVPELLHPPSRQQHSGPGNVAPAGAAAAAAASRQSEAKGPTAAAAAAAPEMPLLVVGSERGVTLLRVLVDDAALAEQQHLQALLQQAEEVRVSDAAGGAKCPVQTGSTGAQDRRQQQQQQHRGSGRSCGRVTLQELSSSSPMFQGVVTKVSSSGSCVVAQESLGPVTAFRAVCVTPGGWVQLLSVGSDDRSKLVAADFVMQPAAALSVQVPSASHGLRTHAAGTAGAGEAAGDLAAAEQAQQQQEAAPRNQAILVAVHPAGLMLLQRDLQEESQHVSSLMQAAQDAWETGQRPDDPLARGQGILLTRPGVSAQPWQGAGEAAPWAGMNAVQRQQQIAQQLGWLGAEAGERAPHEERARLASEAAAAGGVAQATGLAAVRPDWLAFMNVQPGLAPAMLPSACCAPAPGASLLCQVRLGLRPAGSGVADSSTVLCLSATSSVGLAWLLPPEPFYLLEEWQLRPEITVSEAQGQLMQWTRGALDTRRVMGDNLRGLLSPDAVCSYEHHHMAPGALHAGLREAGRRQQDVKGQRFGAVDGDLLFVGVHMRGGSQQWDATCTDTLVQLSLPL